MNINLEFLTPSVMFFGFMVYAIILLIFLVWIITLSVKLSKMKKRL